MNLEVGQIDIEASQWLERVVEHYHACLLRSPEAQGHLRSLGTNAPEIVTSFRIGYADGTLPKTLSAQGRQTLKRIGILNKAGREVMRGCIIFPLLDSQSGHVINLYGYHHKQNQHLYLPREQRGIFNLQAARNTDEIIIAANVLDAAMLWSIGIRHVLPAYEDIGLTDEIIAYLAECRIRRVVLLSGSNEANSAATEQMHARLTDVSIRVDAVELPTKGISDFITGGGTADDVRQLITEQTTTTTSEPKPATQFETAADGTLIFTVQERTYRIRGLSSKGLDRLKVNLRLTGGGNFHLDTLDLYHARARLSFAQMAAKLCGINEQHIGADLLVMIEGLEAMRLEMRNNGAKETDAAMTAQERDSALSFLRSPNLCERIVEDFGRCGFVGARSTILTAYLASISRKLSEPLAVLIVARSGAGKSALQDALCAFVPPEDAVRVTRLTGQALFYKDPNSLKRKVLAIAEEEGATGAVYSLRTLASDQHLTIAATRTDQQSGKLQTAHYEVFGPVVIVITTTSAEAFDEETRSRFVQLTMDESREQTRIILEQQRRRFTLAGVMERSTSENVQRLHHNAQRLLRPLEVVNPYVEYLTYPADRLLHRREQKKYLALINAIALLRQHQREIKRAVSGNAEIEYVEVTLDDIALAGELAREVLGRALDELSAPVRGMYRELQQLFKQRADELHCEIGDVQLSRREIRDATGWSDWQVRAYCKQLVEMEYLSQVSGANGKRFVYGLVWYGDEEKPTTLNGLVDVSELRKQFKETADAA